MAMSLILDPAESDCLSLLAHFPQAEQGSIADGTLHFSLSLFPFLVSPRPLPSHSPSKTGKAI